MATTNIGRIGFVLKGDWIAGTYKYLDVVRHDTHSYACALTSGTSTEPSLINTDWTVLTSDGLSIGSDATSLQTTGASVNVNLASPPTTGKILVATDATHATWQDITSKLHAIALYF